MIGLVSCSATKLDRPAPARELYTSRLFRLSLAYALDRCSAVYVLSALHGLVALDRELQPYDHRLGGKQERARWARGVAGSIASRHAKHEDVLVLAGADYARPLIAALRSMDGYRCIDRATDSWAWLGWTGAIVEPLAGMQIGDRLAFLAAARRAAA